MTKTNKTRSALVTSIISLLLCVSMLVGTTFAWFTDSVVSGRNVITAGNLDVELYANGAKVDSTTELFDAVDPELWEPGAVAYENLQVKNVGTLALKYNLELNVLEETTVEGGYKLSDVIKVGYVGEAVSGTREEVLAKVTKWENLSTYNLNMYGKELAAKTDDSVFALVLYWAPNSNEIDNLYNLNNGKTGEMKLEIGVNLLATQLEAESDSFGNDYDEDAYNLPVVNDAEELLAAMANGESVKLGKDIALEEAVVVPANVTLNLNGKTLSGTGNETVVLDGGELTVDGESKVVNAAGNGIAIALQNGATLNVKGGSIESDGDGIYDFGGGNEINVTGGTVTAKGLALDVEDGSSATISGGTLSGKEVVWGWDNAVISITGGTLNGYVGGSVNTEITGGTFNDPDADEYLADGYQMVDNGNGTYTAMKGDSYVKNTDELVAAIKAGKQDIVLADGNYVMPTSFNGSGVSLQGKTLKISGTRNAVIETSHVDERDQYVTGANLSFEGVTLNFGTANYMGFANTASLTYKDCAINGLQFCYGNGVYTFENCDLNSNGAEHSLWTWSGDKTVSFTGCNFTYGDRAVNCYGENGTTDISFTGCTFTKVAGKATSGAIETNSSALTALNLTIDDCSVNEGDLWFVADPWDSLKGAKTTVTVDGKVEVATAEQLAAVVAKGATEIYLMDGEYYVPACQNKTFTLNGGKGAVIDASYEYYGYQILSGANITFNGVTIKGTDSNFTCKGFQHATVSFNDCVIVNELILNGDSVFTNCTFNTTGNIYSIWTWGAPTATFTECTFNTDGKAILLYGGASGTAEGEITTVLTLNNCIFNDSGALEAKKAAVEVGNGYTNANYKLVVNETVVNGYEINDEGINTGSTLWGNKNSMGTDTLDVIVDGVDVY